MQGLGVADRALIEFRLGKGMNVALEHNEFCLVNCLRNASKRAGGLGFSAQTDRAQNDQAKHGPEKPSWVVCSHKRPALRKLLLVWSGTAQAT